MYDKVMEERLQRLSSACQSRPGIASNAGLTQAYLADMIAGRREIDVEVIEKAEAALELPPPAAGEADEAEAPK